MTANIPGWVHGNGVAFEATEVAAVQQHTEMQERVDDTADGEVTVKSVVDVVHVILKSGVLLKVFGVDDADVLASIVEARAELYPPPSGGMHEYGLPERTGCSQVAAE